MCLSNFLKAPKRTKCLQFKALANFVGKTLFAWKLWHCLWSSTDLLQALFWRLSNNCRFSTRST